MNENQNRESTHDPKYHVQNIRNMMKQVVDHIQDDEKLVQDPQAEALFETTREVLKGLMTAYDHFEHNTEKSWQH